MMGMARSGRAAAELLVRRGASVRLTDTRTSVEGAEQLEAVGVELEFGGHQPETLMDADLIVLSPGVPPDQPVVTAARAEGIEIIGELELAWRWLRGRVIAVTGTKGKSTTTTLVGRMLSASGATVQLGGNIGVPLSSQVDASTPDTVHVVEASSFQLETTISFRPWIAVWLNVSADHFDRHPTFDAYANAKARIFVNQTRDDWAVVNADDALVMAKTATARATPVMFSTTDSPAAGVMLDGDWVVRRTATESIRLFEVSAVELHGRHMLSNALAAAAVASLAGVQTESMAQALRGFHGLEHAMEPAGEVGGVRFVNDSKATNVEAAKRSIETFDQGVVAIIGGRFKGGDLGRLREPLLVRGRAVMAIGESAPLVIEALSDVVPVLEAHSMREAVERGYEAAEPDGVVVLAPACASFDWFRDYAERGTKFKGEVERLRVARQRNRG